MVGTFDKGTRPNSASAIAVAAAGLRQLHAKLRRTRRSAKLSARKRRNAAVGSSASWPESLVEQSAAPLSSSVCSGSEHVVADSSSFANIAAPVPIQEGHLTRTGESLEWAKEVTGKVLFKQLCAPVSSLARNSRTSS